MSRRDELAAALRLKGLNEREIDTLINAAIAEELRAAAEETTSPVPPLEAGPRTEFERGLVTAFHALRRRADNLDGGAR
ncbi:hypothetical protein [Streptomyces sp. CPS1]